MKRFSENMVSSGAPVNNTGSTNSVAGYSSKASAYGPSAGFDKPIRKKKKSGVKEENLDTTTTKSRKRFKTQSTPKPDPQPDLEAFYTKYVESRTFKEFMEFVNKTKSKHIPL